MLAGVFDNCSLANWSSEGFKKGFEGKADVDFYSLDYPHITRSLHLGCLIERRLKLAVVHHHVRSNKTFILAGIGSM